MIEALFTGLLSGTACLSSCGSILIPYLMSRQISIKQSWIVIISFLISRYFFYMVTGCLIAFIGKTLIYSTGIQQIMAGISYMLLGILLIRTIQKKDLHNCKKCNYSKYLNSDKYSIYIIPIMISFTNAIGFCPAVIYLFSQRMIYENIGLTFQSYTLFCLGASVYFLPIPLISLSKNNKKIRDIGFIASWIMAIYLIGKSIILIINGTNYAIG
ncbi:MAG: sulfite exporter TauE/SafE family protein [Calditrichaceae bacterium]